MEIVIIVLKLLFVILLVSKVLKWICMGLLRICDYLKF